MSITQHRELHKEELLALRLQLHRIRAELGTDHWCWFGLTEAKRHIGGLLIEEAETYTLLDKSEEQCDDFDERDRATRESK